MIDHAACEASSLAVEHQGFLDQVDHVPEVVEPLEIRLQQVLSELNVFLVKSVRLQMAVEFLQGRVLKVTEVEVVDGEVVDKQFGDLQQLSGDLLRFADGFVADEVDNILSEGQNYHVEPRRCLKVVFFVVLLLLRVQCSESQFLVVSGD